MMDRKRRATFKEKWAARTIWKNEQYREKLDPVKIALTVLILFLAAMILTPFLP